jgi:hypothetical protein
VKKQDLAAKEYLLIEEVNHLCSEETSEFLKEALGK